MADKEDPDKRLSFMAVWKKITTMFHENNSVLNECALINTQRIYYMSIIAIPLRFIDIFLFVYNKSYDTPVLKVWSRGVVISHLVLLFFLVLLFLVTRQLHDKKEAGTVMYVLPYLVVAVLMASGIAIVTIDQLVTTNITPFLLVCVICGTFFLIRPLNSFLIYVASYVAYYNAIALTITSQEVLLSNRVNGVTAVGIGFFLNFLLWNYNCTNIIQKRRIEMQQKQLEELAYYDALTGLPNRRLLERMIKRELSLMQRHGHESIIIVLDIDNFKCINDTYGHPVGDSILRQMAALLKNSVRTSDTVSRFGGEEFIILMPNTSVDGGYVFAERLRKTIMEKEFIVGPDKVQITSSFGVSSLRDINSPNPDHYYLLADKALYLAKQSGKNRVEVACESRENDVAAGKELNGNPDAEQ